MSDKTYTVKEPDQAKKYEQLLTFVRELERWGFNHSAEVRAKAIKVLREVDAWEQ